MHAVSASRARSYLFVPGNRPERFAKAEASGADQVILDLEDAVPPAEKLRAREKVQRWLETGHAGMVRLNAPGSEWFADDLEMCQPTGVTGVILPKTESGEDIRSVAQVLRGIPIFPLIETAQGVWNAHGIAMEPGVERLVLGALDLQLDLRVEGDGEELDLFRSHLVLVSRVAGLASPVDGVSTAIEDIEQVRNEAARARRLGFGAKLCIHPRQVPVIHACFAPTEEQRAWAQRVKAAAEAAGGAAAMVDGKMIDRPVIEQAEGILARLEELGG